MAVGVQVPLRVPPAGIAQLVEHNLAKVGVASSSLVSRSKKVRLFSLTFFANYQIRRFVFCERCEGVKISSRGCDLVGITGSFRSCCSNQCFVSPSFSL